MSAGFVVEDINHPSKDFIRLKGQISTSISPKVHAQTDLRLTALWAQKENEFDFHRTVTLFLKSNNGPTLARHTREWSENIER